MWLLAVMILFGQAAQPQVMRIVIEKSARKMALYTSDGVSREYRVALGGQPVEPRIRLGANPGGEIMIHGPAPKFAYLGTPVEIQP